MDELQYLYLQEIKSRHHHPYQVMKTFTTTTLLALAAAAHALPPTSETPSLAERASPPVQSVTLLFQAGPASYNLTIPADGKDHPTGESALSVNLIVAPDYDPYRYCTFRTAGGPQQVTFAPSLVQRPGLDPWPINEVAVGPPQPILSVACSGVCLGVYGRFFSSSVLSTYLCPGPVMMFPRLPE